MEDIEIIRFSYFFTYLIIAGFTYFLSYKKTEANKKILINEERYRTIFQSAPMGIMIFDQAGNIFEVNKSLSKLTNCSVSLAEGNYLIPRASSSEVENDAVTPISKGVAGKVCREGTSCIDNNISETPEAKAIQDTYKSGLSIPIKDSRVFQAVSTELRAFSQEDLELAELLISHTTAALKRINSQKELRHKTFHDKFN